MSESETTKRADDRETGRARREAAGEPAAPRRGESDPPSLFLQIASAAAIALLAVVAAQSFFTARDVSLASQNVVALAARLQAETERTQKLYDEVVILRGQVGELKNLLQITSRQGSGGAAGETPPGPRDWTGVYISSANWRRSCPSLPSMKGTWARPGSIPTTRPSSRKSPGRSRR